MPSRAGDSLRARRRGVASGREITVRAFPWLIAGHERHHLDIIRERYLQPGAGASRGRPTSSTER